MFKRALIVAAVAAACSASAYAEVTISGSAELDVMYYSNQTADGKGKFAIDTPVVLNFDGVDKWDNGMSTIWRISQKPGPGGSDKATAPVAFGTREAYIGAKGGFGSVKFGRIFQQTYLQKDWPYLTDGSGNTGEDRGVGSSAFFDNAIGYEGTFGAVNVFASADLGNGFTDKKNGSQGYELGGGATFGAFHIDASYLAQKNGAAATDGKVDSTGKVTAGTAAVSASGYDSTFFVGGRGAFGPLTLSLDWAHDKYDRTDVKEDAIHGKVGYSFNDKLSLNAGWTHIKDNGAGDKKADQLSTQLAYNLSKNTMAFVQYRYIKLGGAGLKPEGFTWQAQGIDSSKDSMQRLVVGTWTGF
ncbi:porin [Iodobacter sp.]|uniref:porin n=1 Tax=Iodobacter sp. TaxID=1915058 RepID=UPI0025F1AA3F|nr:porin [Iodobacter sp.]